MTVPKPDNIASVKMIDGVLYDEVVSFVLSATKKRWVRHYEYHRLCCWCEKQRLPKKKEKIVHEVFCGHACYNDYVANSYPNWMTIQRAPMAPQEIHFTDSYLCLSAPNRYRQMFRKRSNDVQTPIIERQRAEYPWLPFPRGLDFDAHTPPECVCSTWDMVLVWGGPHYLLEHHPS